jgi:hypothetical protein
LSASTDGRAAVAARDSATRIEPKEMSMAARFMCKALLTAALAIALSPLLAATTATGPASSNTAGALQIDPPAAPSHCGARTTTVRDRRKGNYTYTVVSWRDNSSNEDGFIVEEWRKNQSGVWVLRSSIVTAANSTAIAGTSGPDIKYRVKAFNASGESPWSNWGR